MLYNEQLLTQLYYKEIEKNLLTDEVEENKRYRTKKIQKIR
jgi:hypothetical protein